MAVLGEALGDALDKADAEVAALYEQRPYPEPETVESFLACPAPVLRPPRAPGPETRFSEARRGYLRCERNLRAGLNDIATPPCVWGGDDGVDGLLVLPMDTNLSAVARTNNTFGHHGEMAWQQMYLF